MGSSPYFTGGGGVTLEHAYAGSVLGGAATRPASGGLGDKYRPAEVGLQQEAEPRVDDLVVEGTSPGGRRTLRLRAVDGLVLGNYAGARALQQREE